MFSRLELLQMKQQSRKTKNSLDTAKELTKYEFKELLNKYKTRVELIKKELKYEHNDTKEGKCRIPK
jgi:hypothetical protein